MPLLQSLPVVDVAGAVALMQSIHAVLPDDDGLKWFNYLYLNVTAAARAKIDAQVGWNDIEWLAVLDVTFANLYFSALRSPGTAPRAWRALFEARSRTGICKLQFALAGMNAHINRDLAVALGDTCEATSGTFLDDAGRQADYQRVNTILEEVEASVKQDFLTGPLAVLDATAAGMDDLVAMWSVRAARDAAWVNGGVLWMLRSITLLRSHSLSTLDGTVGLAGRGLLRRLL